MLFRSDWDQLLIAARGGDPHAFGNLVELARDDLRSTATRVTGRVGSVTVSADEVFSDALLAACNRIHALRATNYVGFRYWFASIARNHLRQRLRTVQRRSDLDPALAESDAVQEITLILTDESVGLVRGAAVELPRGQQASFVLRQGLGLAWFSIGFILGRRASSSARLLHYRAAARVKSAAALRKSQPVLAIRA